MRNRPQSPLEPTQANWPLWAGALIVAAIACLALAGPGLAPHDPLQERFIVQHPVTGEFIKPPLAALANPDFPLGTDEFGRDLLSRLLWAIRPTLTLVLVVAAVRLIVGVSLGLTSGWRAGRAARALTAMTAWALALPVQFVALFVIAATGQVAGVWAFIVGLSLTGWAESARLIHEQTRLIKHQPFIEAARALGTSDRQIVARHVLPHVMPLVWMLLAFEISSALLVTAGLGFLGYFINSVWVPLGDFSGIRASGQPDLGQLLSGVTEVQRNPWGVVAAGSVVMLIVLGMNLLGEGLRHQTTPETRRRRGGWAARLDDWREAMTDRLFDPLSPWRQTISTLAGVAGLIAIVVAGGYFLWQAQAGPRSELKIVIPGGHLWAADQHDAQGTYWSATDAPGRPAVAWTYRAEAGFSGGPAVAGDGTLYVAARDRTLRAVTAEGDEIWAAELPAEPMFSPALGASGDVYVVDRGGGLTAITPEGRVRWSIAGRGDPALAGPVTSEAETVYYPTEADIIAVSLDGFEQWSRSLPTYSYASPSLRLSLDGAYLMFEDTVVDARRGELFIAETSEPLDKYFIGTDGQLYLRQQNQLRPLLIDDDGAGLAAGQEWDERSLGLSFRFPREAGVTPNGRTWIYFTSGFEFLKLVWIGRNGQALPPLDYPYRTVRLIGIDQRDTAVVCGLGGARGADLECRANRPGDNAPVWKLALESAAPAIGGALVPQAVYVVTDDGQLVALRDP